MSTMQSFACPNCGGSINFQGTDPTTVCPYCGNTVAVPQALRQPGLDLEAKKALDHGSRYLIIFVILVFGIPTCLAVAGTVIGIGASLLVPVIMLFTAFFFGR
jgi:hypothetical protein